jgi:serine phosphatase RsbU (regulator of sigma subunit)
VNAAQRPPGLRLRITPTAGPPFEHECSAASLVLGRSRKADVAISDQFLSRLHARLFLEEDSWFIEDLGSHNPTLVNDRPLVGRARLAVGDVLRMGGTLVRLEMEAEEAASAVVYRSAVDLAAAIDAAPGPVGDPALRRLAGRLKLLNEVHRALAGPIGLQELLELVLDSAFTHLGPEEAAIFLKQPSGELYRAASRRLPEAPGDFLWSRSLVHEVTEKKLAALVHDAGADARFAQAHSILDSGVRSLVAAPLLDAEGCLGMIALNSRAERRSFAEDDLELLVSLASAAALRIRNLALADEAARHLLMERDLELAREIQMAMLPRQLPSRPELELAALLHPARAVGGDLYDFMAEERRLWLLLGDVSGKGFPSALLMAVTRTLFGALVRRESAPEAVFSAMNRELSRNNESGMFVTAFGGCLDLQSGELRFVNAGHNRPYLLRADGSLRRVDEAAGMALGVLPDVEYQSGRLQLKRGETLYLYTDGVTEALAPNGAQFSESRLESCLRALAGFPAARLVEASVAAVREFAATAPQSDDIAVMALRYLGAP